MSDILDLKFIGSNVLRQKAKKVEEITPALVELAHDMLATMYDAPGVGLAAPQIGHSIRLVVIDIAYREEKDGEENREPKIIFNPEITPIKDCDLVEDEEGCLSLPDIFARVTRPEAISFKYTDEHGQEVVHDRIDGFLARCIQHEVDHLDGHLFVDKINPKDKTLLSAKLKKMARENKGK